MCIQRRTIWLIFRDTEFQTVQLFAYSMSGVLLKTLILIRIKNRKGHLLFILLQYCIMQLKGEESFSKQADLTLRTW